jgi:hypothetical protein
VNHRGRVSSESRQRWVTLAIVAVALAAATLSHRLGGLPMQDLVRDPASTAGHHPLTGVLSTLGVWFLVAAAAVCGFAAGAADPRDTARGLRRFVVGLAAVNLMLAIDDQFMVHELLGAWYLGLTEPYVLLLEGLLVGGLLLMNRRRLAVGGIGSLVAAVGFGVASLAIDKGLESYDTAWRIGAEDGCKLAAFACWSLYSVRTAAAMGGPDGPVDPAAD